MRIAVAREADSAEDRVAATPETVKKLKALGCEVAIEPGAHEIEFRFEPTSQLVGAIVSAISLLVVLTLIAWGLRRA